MTPSADVVPDRATDGLDAGEGWFVYGIVLADDDPVDGLAGLDGHEVVTVRGDRVAALVSRVVVERPPGRAKELVAYSEVLDAVAARRPVVPVRFGAIVPDAGTVVDEVLAPDQDHFLALLADLTGRSQLLLRGNYVEEQVLGEIVRGDPAVAELRARTRGLPEEAAYGDRVRLGELVARAIDEIRAHDTDLLLGQVLPLVDDYVLRPVSGTERVFEVAVLVDDGRRAELEDHLEALAEEVHERIRLQLLGPTAPYDFVGET